MMRAVILSITLAFLSSFGLMAQNPDVRGVVYDSESGVPLPGVQVGLTGTKYQALTDAEGFFNFTAVPVGDYTLTLLQEDYEDFSETITVIAGKNFKKNFYLKKKVVELKNITITAKNARKQREVLIGTTTIDRRDIARMPSVGGEPDLLRFRFLGDCPCCGAEARPTGSGCSRSCTWAFKNAGWSIPVNGKAPVAGSATRPDLVSSARIRKTSLSARSSCWRVTLA